MNKQVKVWFRQVPEVLGSALAWRLMLGLFVLEALWFVASARYPMAFDENYHYGLIQLHAHQWLPYFTSQPHNAAVYGAVVRDPSYLYHWLMSFPYRLLTIFTHNQTTLVVWLRLINIALCTYGIVLYRKILQRFSVSSALSTSLFVVIILIPVVPFLAATINYDNLFFVAVPLSVLLSFRLLDGFTARRIDANALFQFVAVCLLSCLVKYAFLPIAASLVVYLAINMWRAGLISQRGLATFMASFGGLTVMRRILLIAACVLAMGLFGERYISNIATYHNPVPVCNVVINEDECTQYGPYDRDAFYKQQKPASFHASPLAYIWQWVYGMWYRLFFAISYTYATAPPLLVISLASVALAAALLVGELLRFRSLFANQPKRQLVLWATLTYIAVLFIDGFSAYRKTGQPVAINGRYLIPFLPFLAGFGGLAWAELLHKRVQLKALLAVGTILIFLLQGGGTMTFIVRSGDDWMWSNGLVRSVNGDVRSVAWPIILGKGVQ